jgi:hypothetical protein
MKSYISQIGLVACLAVEANSFTTFVSTKATTHSTTSLSAETEDVGRRQFGSQLLAKGFGAAALSSLLVQPANALGLNKLNAQLQGYGLAPVSSIPDGYTGLLQLYGKASNRTPLLVEFVHPFDWVVTLPNIDQNGEEGTIQAGEYAKGDTATLYIYKAPGHVNVRNTLLLFILRTSPIEA